MNENRIPKIIHCCWFGGNEKPELIKKCIKSWEDKLEGYKIIEWNEDNFDINSNVFIKQAYESGKFAFVSDYVRAWALYNYGGIYLDTDVEVYKSFSEDILNNESFWGFEEKEYIATSTIGSQKGNKFIKEFLDSYEGKSFILDDGSIDTLTNVAIVSKMVEKIGVKLNGELQTIDGVGTFYPQEYFSPYDYINCYSKETEKTYTIHHYYKSWLPKGARVKGAVKKTLANVIGGQRVAKLREVLTRG